MALEVYTDQPYTTNLIAAVCGSAAAATVAFVGARSLMDKESRELGPLTTIGICAAAYAVSWIVDSATRRAFPRNP